MAFPQPDANPISAPYWAALREGRLTYQHCDVCGHDWLPPREACPHCLAPSPAWRDASGRATVVSWVVYHTAYDPAFKDRLPYDVTCVELAEGPRLLTNVIDSDAGRRLSLGAAVELAIEREGDLALARFRLIPV